MNIDIKSSINIQCYHIAVIHQRANRMLAVAYLHGLWGRITSKATSISGQYTFNPHIHVLTTTLVLPKSTNSAHLPLAMQLQSTLRMGDWRGTIPKPLHSWTQTYLQNCSITLYSLSTYVYNYNSVLTRFLMGDG